MQITLTGTLEAGAEAIESNLQEEGALICHTDTRLTEVSTISKITIVHWKGINISSCFNTIQLIAIIYF